MEHMLISLSPQDRIEQVRALQALPPGNDTDGPARNKNMLLDLVSRAKNTLEFSHTSMMQYVEKMNQKGDIKPVELLALQHRMAIYSTQTMIVKQIGEELGRGINSITNR